MALVSLLAIGAGCETKAGTGALVGGAAGAGLGASSAINRMASEPVEPLT